MSALNQNKSLDSKTYEDFWTLRAYFGLWWAYFGTLRGVEVGQICAYEALKALVVLWVGRNLMKERNLQ